jgi:hypothetical protein
MIHGHRWYRHPKRKNEPAPVEYPDVMFYGPYLNRHDVWTGLYWEHNVQGWDGGWWEGWRFYLVLLPTVVLQMDVDRSGKLTRAARKWWTAERARQGYKP